MYLRMKIGRYAGEVREFPYDVARDLLRNGSAVNAYAEPDAPPVPAPIVTAAATSAPRASRKTAR